MSNKRAKLILYHILSFVISRVRVQFEWNIQAYFITKKKFLEDLKPQYNTVRISFIANSYKPTVYIK